MRSSFSMFVVSVSGLFFFVIFFFGVDILEVCFVGLFVMDVFDCEYCC